MAGYTPGPWGVHGLRDIVVPDSHRSRPIGGAADKAADLATYAQGICLVQGRHRSEEEVKANGRLIAAAPDLLKVAQFLTSDWPDIAHAKGLAIAAIAKATGATP